jgi:hypothetical protein
MHKAATAHHKVFAKAGNHRAVWIGGLALVGAGAAGFAIYLTTRKSSSSPANPALPPGPPGPPGPPAPAGQMVNVTLSQGHRYTLTMTCPSTTSTPQMTGIKGIQIVSATPLASGGGGTIVFDYLGPTGTYPINPSGCTINVADNGVSPLPATGDIYSSLSAIQQGSVQAALYDYISGTPNCPTIMTSAASQGITSAAQLADAGDRAYAVECWQSANGMTATGVFDLATYTALMG